MIDLQTSSISYPPSQETSGYRGFIQGKTRVALAWVFAILLGLSARDYPKWHGIVLCFLGATLRFWASGYLRKDSRPAIGGPYAWVRNPLYLGTYLMALGTALAIEAWWLLASITVIFAAVYHYIILDEETKLIRIFGDPYVKYLQTVPRFFPKPWPASRDSLREVNSDANHRSYCWKMSMKNKAYESYLTFAGIIGFVGAVAYFWQNRG